MTGEKVRVFLVDDNDIDLAVNGKLLRIARIADEVHTFQQPRLFLESLPALNDLTEFLNVLLLDIMMPGMNGFEFMHEFLRLPEEVTSKFRIFMLSSTIDRRDIQNAEKTPLVQRVLEKPLDTYLLKSLICQPVSSFRSSHELER